MTKLPMTKPPMTKPNGIHHLAISTDNMKEQLTFFTQVLGMELVALYWMHGVEGAWHGFCRLNDQCSIAFVFTPGNKDAKAVIGQTHAGHGGGASAPGTMQHLSLNVDTDEELFAMRDRIRSHGVPVFGPADHGMCKSIYFAGPEGQTLEVATSPEPIDARQWIDPEVVALAGISDDELAAMKNPPAGPDGPVKQPAFDPTGYHMHYPEPIYRMMLQAPDEMMMARMSYTEPPVPLSPS